MFRNDLPKNIFIVTANFCSIPVCIKCPYWAIQMISSFCKHIMMVNVTDLRPIVFFTVDKGNLLDGKNMKQIKMCCKCFKLFLGKGDYFI